MNLIDAKKAFDKIQQLLMIKTQTRNISKLPQYNKGHI